MIDDEFDNTAIVFTGVSFYRKKNKEPQKVQEGQTVEIILPIAKKRIRDKEKQREYNRRHYKENKQKILAKLKEDYANSPESYQEYIKEKNKEWKLKNKKKYSKRQKIYAKKYRKEHPEKIRKKNKKYNEKGGEKLVEYKREYAREYYLKNKEKILEAIKKRRQKTNKRF